MPIRFYLRKLVRDKVLDNILNDPKVLEVDYHLMDRKEFTESLIDKIHEEADEIPVLGEVNDEIIKEIADVQEVIDELIRRYGIATADIRAAQENKRNKVGGFENKVYIDNVLLDDASEWIDVFRDQPHKYTEEASDGNLRSDDVGVKAVTKGTYRHSKTGNLYEVIGTALHTETNELLVVYKPKRPSEYELFTRPIDMFTEEVVIEGQKMARFEKVCDDQ